jgi:hypothetical protein
MKGLRNEGFKPPQYRAHGLEDLVERGVFVRPVLTASAPCGRRLNQQEGGWRAPLSPFP